MPGRSSVRTPFWPVRARETVLMETSQASAMSRRRLRESLAGGAADRCMAVSCKKFSCCAMFAVDEKSSQIMQHAREAAQMEEGGRVARQLDRLLAGMVGPRHDGTVHEPDLHGPARDYIR